MQKGGAKNCRRKVERKESILDRVRKGLIKMLPLELQGTVMSQTARKGTVEGTA